MKHSSKSLYSPGRPGAVDPSGTSTAASSTSSSVLHPSLSRRMRHSGSLSGGGQASPMFPPAGGGKKKAAAAFEEPSSPKVTCIGQVRVKTRKQGKRMRAAAGGRSRSRRRSEGGGSFRERERQRYWAALPISICEAVRALGAEFNCFHSCGSGGQSWCGSETPSAEKEKAGRKRPARSYCGAVFARWLVALDDDQEEVEEKEKEVSHIALSRKLEDGRLERLGKAAVVVEDTEELEGEYEVCVPPKNALLLMRCRSEPFRMASYSNQCWESPANLEIDRGEAEGVDVEEGQEEEEPEKDNTRPLGLKAEIEENYEAEVEGMKKGDDGGDVAAKEEDKAAISVLFRSDSSRRSSVCVEDGATVHDFDLMIQEEQFECSEKELATEHESSPSLAQKDDNFAMDEHIETPNSTVYSSESVLETIEEEAEKTTQLIEEQKEEVVIESGENVDNPPTEEDDGKSKEEEDGNLDVKDVGVTVLQSEAVTGSEEEVMSAVEVLASPVPPPATAEEKVKEEEDGALPECLLLMLYEPKLSMEVSKETWVCSTDFFQWRPGRRTKLVGDTAVPGVVEARRNSTDSRPSKPSSGGVVESRRNSTDSRPSKPSGNRVAAAPSGRPPAPTPSMTSAVEEKLVKAAAYEPLVLTRCKSEPMRTSARLAPEACFWKSGRKLPQPPRRSLRADPVS